MINFSEYGISKYTVRNKKGGLQAGKVYRLVLRDPAPVLIDTQLPGAYAVINGDTKKHYADSNGRITIENAPSGDHVATIYAADGSVLLLPLLYVIRAPIGLILLHVLYERQ